MKLILLLSSLIISIASFASEEAAPFGQIISNNEGDTISFSCLELNDKNECLNGNFLLTESGSSKDRVTSLNAKSFNLSDTEDLFVKLKARNKKVRGRYLNYTRNEISVRNEKDGSTPFATINLLKEKSRDTSDKLMKVVRLPMTLLVDDILHYSVIPVVESGIFVGKTANYLVKTKRQKILLAKLLDQDSAGDVTSISNGRFRRMVRTLTDILSQPNELN